VLLYDNAGTKWKPVWTVRQPGLMGTFSCVIISDADLKRLPKEQVLEEVYHTNGLYLPGEVEVYADSINPEIAQNKIRWVVGSHPLLIGIGVDPRPPVPTTAGSVPAAWSALIRADDMTREVQAVIDAGDGVVLPSLSRNDLCLPQFITLYILRRPMSLQELEEGLSRSGLQFLR